MIRPLSVVNYRDNKVLPLLFGVHCYFPSPRILDCTYNRGVMWRGSGLAPSIRMDIDPQWPVDVVGDFTAMPFADASFDMIVFDPPHLPNAAGSKNSSRIWERAYGITGDGKGREGDNVCPLFPAFLREANRVLVPEGLVFCKIADLVHNHRYQWQHVDFINATQTAGMTPCDLIVKQDPRGGGLKSSKWKSVKHFRNAHCYWIVVRNSHRCEAPHKA